MKLGPDEKGAEKGEPKRSVKSVNLRVKSGGEQRASHIYDPQSNCCKKTWVEEIRLINTDGESERIATPDGIVLLIKFLPFLSVILILRSIS